MAPTKTSMNAPRKAPQNIIRGRNPNVYPMGVRVGIAPGIKRPPSSPPPVDSSYYSPPPVTHKPPKIIQWWNPLDWPLAAQIAGIATLTLIVAAQAARARQRSRSTAFQDGVTERQLLEQRMQRLVEKALNDGAHVKVEYLTEKFEGRVVLVGEHNNSAFFRLQMPDGSKHSFYIDLVTSVTESAPGTCADPALSSVAPRDARERQAALPQSEMKMLVKSLVERLPIEIVTSDGRGVAGRVVTFGSNGQTVTLSSPDGHQRTFLLSEIVDVTPGITGMCLDPLYAAHVRDAYEGDHEESAPRSSRQEQARGADSKELLHKALESRAEVLMTHEVEKYHAMDIQTRRVLVQTAIHLWLYEPGFRSADHAIHDITRDAVNEAVHRASESNPRSGIRPLRPRRRGLTPFVGK